MERSTLFAATALLLFASPAGAVVATPETQPQGAVLPGTAATTNNAPSFTLPGRAQRPTYDKRGWQCPPGFVWRNAGRTDWLCVDPFEARRIEQENQQASGNWIKQPDGSRACRAGMVTRDATRKDGVCVDPLRRELVRQMNLALYTVR